MGMNSKSSAAKNATIVVIDDDASICDSVADLLSLENWDCVTAKSGQDGLDLVESLKPQMVVTDIQLPDISGYQVCQNIKRDPEIARRACGDDDGPLYGTS